MPRNHTYQMQGFVFSSFQRSNIGKVRLQDAIYFCFVMVKELLTYISHRLSEEITLEDLSRISGYSPFHLHRKIKEELGEPVGDFIKRQRIETAAQLLVLTSIPVADIKYLVGYNNDSAFSKAFKSLMNVSPRTFRASNVLKAASGKLSSNNYVSLSYEVTHLPKQEAIVFPAIGNYFSKDIYTIWKEVQAFINHEGLIEKDFDYYAVLHACQNVTPSPARYDAVIIPRTKNKLTTSRFFKSEIPGGKFVRYRFCCPVSKYKENTLLINKHMSEETQLQHGAGVSYFKFLSLPDYENPDNQLIEWLMPIK